MKLLVMMHYHEGFIIEGVENCGAVVEALSRARLIEKKWNSDTKEDVYSFVENGKIEMELVDDHFGVHTPHKPGQLIPVDSL